MDNFATRSTNNPAETEIVEQKNNPSTSTNPTESEAPAIKEEDEKTKEDNRYGMVGLLDIFKSPNADILVKGNDLKFLGFDFNSDEYVKIKIKIKINKYMYTKLYY